MPHLYQALHSILVKTGQDFHCPVTHAILMLLIALLCPAHPQFVHVIVQASRKCMSINKAEMFLL